MVIQLMKIKSKIILLSVFVVFVLFLSRHYFNSQKVFSIPENADFEFQTDFKKSSKSEDLNYLCFKTGLSPWTINKYIESGNTEFIKYMFNIYNKVPEYETQYIFYPFTSTERNISSKTPLSDLKNGDILITFNTHTLDWRHGHCAIVVDDDEMKILEHVSIGKKSVINDAYEWGRYPAFVVLRYPDSFVSENAARYAKNNLLGIDYSLFCGIFDEKNNNQKSNCSHIVWLAYYSQGVDIDGNGGRIVTPKDILSCTSLEVVQLFGMNNEDFDTRWVVD